MSAPTPAVAPAGRTGHLTSPFVALLGYTVRACVPPRRRSVLALPALGAVLFGLIARAASGTPADNFATASTEGIFSLVLPLCCLVLGDAVLGAEARSGTLALTWLSPVPFRTIVAARRLGGWLIALATLVPAGVVACIVAGQPNAVAAMAIALAAGSAAYVAIFVMIGAVARRAAVWSIAFVILVERLVGTALASVAQISPMWLARTTFDRLAELETYFRYRSGMPHGWSAVSRLGLLTAVALLLAAWRLRRIVLAGPAD
jgi:ABC-type transport system involved in multi-copper enzyme maturation permease subunit